MDKITLWEKWELIEELIGKENLEHIDRCFDLGVM